MSDFQIENPVEKGDGKLDSVGPGGGSPLALGVSGMENVQAALGVPWPLAYGYASIVGNELYQVKTGDGTRYAFIGGGEGEWDGLERGWINKKSFDVADTSIVHFHPGIDGEVGDLSVGGDQKLDLFWSVIPTSVKRVTFSRMAYFVLIAAPDPGATSATLEWLLHVRTMKIRDFDNTGAQTGYAFSTNPIRQRVDLTLRRQLFPDFAPGEEPPAAVKARIDWPCYTDSRDYCDALLASGKKRFESSLAWASRVKLSDAESQLRMMYRGYDREVKGKIQYRVDQARAVSFSMSGLHVQPGSVQIDEKDVDGATNRYLGVFRELNPPILCSIASIQRVGGVTTVQTTTPHPFLVGDDCEAFDVNAEALDGTGIVATQPDDTHFTFAQTGADTAVHNSGHIGTPNERFSQSSCVYNHEAHQAAMGQVGVGIDPATTEITQTFDFGANTFERVSRLLQYMAVRNLGRDQVPYLAPKQGRMTLDVMAVDGFGARLLDLAPGDLIAVGSGVTEEQQGTFEMMDDNLSVQGGDDGAAGTCPMTVLEYIPDAFTDVPLEQPV
jgi:hypothetical protein